MTDEQVEVVALAKQIQRACRRQLDAVFLPAKRASDVAKLPLLAAQVERVRPVGWRTSPSEALTLVLCAVADQLEGTHEHLNGTWADFGRYMVGAEDDTFTAELGIGTMPRYNARLAAVRKRLLKPVGEDLEEARRDDLWLLMAQCLLQMRPQQTLPKPPPGGKLSGEVHRAGLYAEGRQALIGASRVVVLWGESGNGKSYLARQIQRDLCAGQRVAFIGEDAGTPSNFDRDILACLRGSGVPAEGWDAVAREQAFIELLSDHGSFDLVIFDNVSHARLVHLLARSAVKSLVTSRESFEVEGGESIWVPAYSKDEALAAATAAMPDVPQKDLAAFCDDVGYRPLVIDLAGKLLAVSEVTLSSLRASARLNAPNAVEGMYSMVGAPAFSTPFGEQLSATVIEVYRRLLAYLEDRANVVAALDVLLWLPRTGSVDRLVAMVQDPARGVDEIAAQGGYAELARLALVDPGPALQMNDLTLAILRALMAPRARDAIARFLTLARIDNLPEKYQKVLRDETAGGTPLMRLMTSGDDLSGPEAVWATMTATLMTTQRAISNLAPGRQVQFFQVAPGEYIVVQHNCEVIAPIDGIELGFVEVGPKPPPVITTGAGVRRELDAEYAFNVCQYALLSNAATRVNGTYKDEPEGGSGLELWRSPDDGIDHDLLSVFPRDVAAAHALRVWSRCGSWFTPDASNDGPQTPCQKCASARHHRDGWSDYRSDLRALWFLREPDGDDWRFLAMIYSALAFIVAENAEVPNEMPEEALPYNADDPGEIGMYIAWCHLFFAKDIVANEVEADMITLAKLHLGQVLRALNQDSYEFAPSDQVRLLAEVGLVFAELEMPVDAATCVAAGRRIERAEQVEEPIVLQRLDELASSINGDSTK